MAYNFNYLVLRKYMYLCNDLHYHYSLYDMIVPKFSNCYNNLSNYCGSGAIGAAAKSNRSARGCASLPL